MKEKLMKIEAAAAVLAASLSVSIAAADLVAAPDCRNKSTARAAFSPTSSIGFRSLGTRRKVR